jgi:N utilization substance protein B
LIYELDLRPDITADEAIEMFAWGQELPDVAEYAKFLVTASSRRALEIDSLMREHIVGWRTERMVAVDRASIKLAVCEGIIERKVPVAVAISEAVELTKIFGTIESSGFVNGVLGKIARSFGGDTPERDAR